MTIAFNSTTESGFIKSDFDQISAYLSGADDSTTLETRLDGVDSDISTLQSDLSTSESTLTTKINSLIHRKVYSSAAEVSNSGAGWQDTAKTFNLSAPVNSLILQINVWCQVKNSSTGISQVGLKINGTNFGTKYLVSTRKQVTVLDTDTVGDCILSASEETNVSNTPITKTGDYATAYESFRTLQPIKILDYSTTFTFRIRFDGTGTASLKNVNCEIIYVENFEED